MAHFYVLLFLFTAIMLLGVLSGNGALVAFSGGAALVIGISILRESEQ